VEEVELVAAVPDDDTQPLKALTNRTSTARKQTVLFKIPFPFRDCFVIPFSPYA
jgi:hypothetical protein